MASEIRITVRLGAQSASATITEEDLRAAQEHVRAARAHDIADRLAPILNRGHMHTLTAAGLEIV